jgi:hypothetical protein
MSDTRSFTFALERRSYGCEDQESHDRPAVSGAQVGSLPRGLICLRLDERSRERHRETILPKYHHFPEAVSRPEDRKLGRCRLAAPGGLAFAHPRPGSGSPLRVVHAVTWQTRRGRRTRGRRGGRATENPVLIWCLSNPPHARCMGIFVANATCSVPTRSPNAE